VWPVEKEKKTMKARLLTIAAIAALAIAPAALGGSWHKVRDGNAWVYSAGSSPKGLTVITDTLGGNGTPAEIQPYVYGGAPKAVADAYQRYMGLPATSSASGFYRAHLSDGKPVTSVSISDTRERYVTQGDVVDRYVGNVVDGRQVNGTQADALDRYLGNVNDGSSSTGASRGSTFSWADASIGAGAALVALILLMTLSTLSGRGSRKLAV
jgi:hypothetical protein